MLNNHQGNANQNHSEIPPHTNLGRLLTNKEKKAENESVGKDGEKLELLYTVGGNVI